MPLCLWERELKGAGELGAALQLPLGRAAGALQPELWAPNCCPVLVLAGRLEAGSGPGEAGGRAASCWDAPEMRNVSVNLSVVGPEEGCASCCLVDFRVLNKEMT